MYYWRSTSQFEVDLILGDYWALEIKSTTSITDKHLRGIRALKEEGKIRNFAVISLDRHERRTTDNITVFPWKVFLKRLWEGELI